MNFRLRDDLDELAAYASAVSDVSGIPASHVEKDYWVTETLRGVAGVSRRNGCSVIFKGGTSLSKAHRLIERFSEDVDLLIVLPEAGKKRRDRMLKEFIAGAEAATGIEGRLDVATATAGVKRSVRLHYPTAAPSEGVTSGVLLELGTRGGALPCDRRPIQSLIAEYSQRAGLASDFEEVEPISLLVLDPVRTLVEKMMILHHAATVGDSERRRQTARHYYDVDALLRSPAVMSSLEQHETDVLARQVARHSMAAGLPSIDRPPAGFSASPAWREDQPDIERAYEDVLERLVWPSALTSAFAQCCQRVHDHAHLL